MDCLVSLRGVCHLWTGLRRVAPASCLLWAAALGCNHLEKQELVKLPDGQTVAVEKEKEGPKRSPKPTSLVTFADFRAAAANEPDKTPAVQEFLRDQARRAYQQAIELDPNCVEAYTGLATLYQDISEYERADATYDKALKRSPKNATLWFKYGMCQARHKDYDAAVTSLRTAATLDPENKRFASTLGYCLARSGRFDEAYTYFVKEMGEAKAHYNVARMLHHVKRDAECKVHLELALKAGPELQDARKLMAELEKADGTNKDVVPVSVSVVPIN